MNRGRETCPDLFQFIVDFLAGSRSYDSRVHAFTSADVGEIQRICNPELVAVLDQFDGLVRFEVLFVKPVNRAVRFQNRYRPGIIRDPVRVSYTGSAERRFEQEIVVETYVDGIVTEMLDHRIYLRQIGTSALFLERPNILRSTVLYLFQSRQPSVLSNTPCFSRT